MAQSETAFTMKRADGPGYALRWFTPKCEVDLCGHATLAAAHALRAEQSATLPLVFHTRSGPLRVAADADADAGLAVLQMAFPSAPAEAAPAAAAGFLRQALVAAGVGPPLWVGKSAGLDDTLVVLSSERAVRDAEPDVAALGRLGGRGVILTAAAESGSGYDVVSRRGLGAPACGDALPRALRMTERRGQLRQVLLPEHWHSGGPGHRQRALRPGAVLGRQAGQGQPAVPAGQRARRRGARDGGAQRHGGAAVRPRRHGCARRDRCSPVKAACVDAVDAFGLG